MLSVSLAYRTERSAAAESDCHTVALTLVVLLKLAERRVSALGTQSRLVQPLRRLSRAAVESGAVPAAWAVLALGLYLYKPETNSESIEYMLTVGSSQLACFTIAVGPALLCCSGRISGLNLLYNLNLRNATFQSIMCVYRVFPCAQPHRLCAGRTTDNSEASPIRVPSPRQVGRSASGEREHRQTTEIGIILSSVSPSTLSQRRETRERTTTPCRWSTCHL